MRGKTLALTLVILLAVPIVCLPAHAAAETILGKWAAKAETPNGPLDLGFEWKMEGGNLVGSAAVMGSMVAFTSVKFEDPNLTAEFTVGGGTYRLLGLVKDGKITGTWERVGSEMKGTWNAMRPEVPVPVSAGAGLTGVWDSVASTPNGEMAAKLELKQDGENITGQFVSPMGNLPIQNASLKANKLQFEINLGGDIYRIQGALEADKISGGWAPAAGGDGGPWTAKRSGGAKPAAEDSSAWAEGIWLATAVTPMGDMQFRMEFKKAAEGMVATLATQEAQIPVKNLKAASGMVIFDIDYMGGTYRIEGKVEGDALTGRWSGGGESGAFKAQRQKP